MQAEPKSTGSSSLQDVARERRPKTREEVVSSKEHRDLSTPKLAPGDPAFDFTLPLLDRNYGLTGQSVTLSDHAGHRPVALIFGSYT